MSAQGARANLIQTFVSGPPGWGSDAEGAGPEVGPDRAADRRAIGGTSSSPK